MIEKDEKKRFLKHHAAGGLNVHDVVGLGRKAAWFFKDQFGIDFTRLSPDSYLYSGHLIEGVSAFRPFMFDANTDARLTAAIRKDRVQFFNKPVSFAGWQLMLQNDYVSRGAYNGTIPKGAFLRFGSFTILPCEGEPYGQCKNILRPEDPAKPIFFLMRQTVGFDRKPETFRVLDFVVDSPDFGKGLSVGLRTPTEIPGKYILSVILIFRGHKY